VDASKKTRIPEARAWLFNDERGTWEKRAGELFHQVELHHPRIASQHAEIVRDRLLYEVLEVLLADSMKSKA
jgi:hypothetical protein